MTFAEELKQWRGKRGQKEVHGLFGVSLGAYKAWELGVNEPTDLAKCEIRWRISADVQGVPVSTLKARYFSAIKQVVSEIQNKK